MKTNELQAGEYRLAEGLTAKLKKGVLVVRPVRYRRTKGGRCRDCKHFATGHSTLSPRFPTTICKKKPKQLQSGETLFYHVNPYATPCGMFEPKEPKDDDREI